MWYVVWLSILILSSSAADNCTETWFHLSDDGQCVCGSTLFNAIICNNATRQVLLQKKYCLTSDGLGSNISVVGKCLLSTGYHPARGITGPHGAYQIVLPNRSAQDEKTCNYLNREGRLCSQCKPNHTLSAYSYELDCHKCKWSTWSSVLLYIGFAYVPLTFFLVVVMVFKISITSPAMNIPILCGQFLSSPLVIGAFLGNTRGSIMYKFIQFAATLYGIWNLDFFRALVPPVCLPLDTLQVISLDYVIAVYPLLLLICFHSLVTARDKGVRLVVCIWKPFLWCTRQVRHRRKLQRTIKDALVTFLLLSYMKLLNTSFSLLASTPLHNENGWLGSFLIVNARIEVMSHQHKPYAIFACCIILLLVFIPTILQLLYPMLWFQTLLN